MGTSITRKRPRPEYARGACCKHQCTAARRSTKWTLLLLVYLLCFEPVVAVRRRLPSKATKGSWDLYAKPHQKQDQHHNSFFSGLAIPTYKDQSPVNKSPKSAYVPTRLPIQQGTHSNIFDERTNKSQKLYLPKAPTTMYTPPPSQQGKGSIYYAKSSKTFKSSKSSWNIFRHKYKTAAPTNVSTMPPILSPTEAPDEMQSPTRQPLQVSPPTSPPLITPLPTQTAVSPTISPAVLPTRSPTDDSPTTSPDSSLSLPPTFLLVESTSNPTDSSATDNPTTQPAVVSLAPTTATSNPTISPVLQTQLPTIVTDAPSSSTRMPTKSPALTEAPSSMVHTPTTSPTLPKTTMPTSTTLIPTQTPLLSFTDRPTVTVKPTTETKVPTLVPDVSGAPTSSPLVVATLFPTPTDFTTEPTSSTRSPTVFPSSTVQIPTTSPTLPKTTMPTSTTLIPTQTPSLSFTDRPTMTVKPTTETKVPTLVPDVSGAPTSSPLVVTTFFPTPTDFTTEPTSSTRSPTVSPVFTTNSPTERHSNSPTTATRSPTIRLATLRPSLTVSPTLSTIPSTSLSPTGSAEPSMASMVTQRPTRIESPETNLPSESTVSPTTSDSIESSTVVPTQNPASSATQIPTIVQTDAPVAVDTMAPIMAPPLIDGISPFAVTYSPIAGTPDEEQYAEVAETTCNFLREWFIYNYSPPINTFQILETFDCNLVATSAGTIQYQTSATFSINSTTVPPAVEELDLIMEAAFFEPRSGILIEELAQFPASPFFTASDVTYNKLDASIDEPQTRSSRAFLVGLSISALVLLCGVIALGGAVCCQRESVVKRALNLPNVVDEIQEHSDAYP